MSRDITLSLLVFMVWLDCVGIISYCYEHPKDLLQSKGLLPSKRFSPLKYGDMMASEASTNGLKPNQMPHFAIYRSSTTAESAFAGAMATFDFYDFPNTKNGSEISAQIWLENDQNSEFDAVISGWEVDPDLYQDSKTHFFVYWTIDGAKSTGCPDLDCTGFVPVNGAPITPGYTLDHSNGQTKISLKIFKSKDDGDWWLHFGPDMNNLSPVGYWPNTLFKNLDHATVVSWAMVNGQKKVQPLYKMFSLLIKMDKGILPIGLVIFMPLRPTRNAIKLVYFWVTCFYYGGPGGCTD